MKSRTMVGIASATAALAALGSRFSGLFEPGRYHGVCYHRPLIDGRMGWPSVAALRKPTSLE
jgi:hypothetical protein